MHNVICILYNMCTYVVVFNFVLLFCVVKERKIILFILGGFNKIFPNYIYVYKWETFIGNLFLNCGGGGTLFCFYSIDQTVQR